MTTPASSPPFFGWRVVAATFVLAAFGWGVGFYGPPVFLHAVVARTGWPVELVSAAVTVHFLVGAAVVANLPRLYRALGVPLVTSLGAGLLGFGVLGWAVAAAPWQLFAAALASGTGWVAMGAAAVNALVAPWFERRRPAALGLAYNGASLGGVVFSPLWAALIGGLGFPLAALAVGAVMLPVVGLLAALVFTRTPEGLGQHPDGEAAAMPAPAAAAPAARPLPAGPPWRDRRLLTLAAGMALGLFAQIGLLAHLFSLLVPALGAAAGLAMGGATLAAILGRSAVGWWMPAWADRRHVACLSHAVQLAGSLLLLAAVAGGGAWVLPGLLLGLALFGLGIGNATSLPPLIAQGEFTAQDARRVVPWIVATGQACYAFAPAIFGLLRGVAERGEALFLLAALVQAAAIGAFLAGQRRWRMEWDSNPR
ncbi:MFS transporter [Teichococcus aestuarii]|uniref:MFS transporter n=1 Tax=Teichococcus aestuarii TaxID=568898 RepID=A0A2U1V0G9_9PROT|nr:MFS transporter [Pseudoroseomonas aestuarii]PWC27384.1 MFS transporter [Pseudoroseomonas aestuarii]